MHKKSILIWDNTVKYLILSIRAEGYKSFIYKAYFQFYFDNPLDILSAKPTGVTSQKRIF